LKETSIAGFGGMARTGCGGWASTRFICRNRSLPAVLPAIMMMVHGQGGGQYQQEKDND